MVAVSDGMLGDRMPSAVAKFKEQHLHLLFIGKAHVPAHVPAHSFLCPPASHQLQPMSRNLHIPLEVGPDYGGVPSIQTEEKYISFDSNLV